MDPQSEILREIGGLFRQARLAAAMTQEQVADLAGISRPRYRDIEKGAAAAR
ncbi:helix-turn-helix domain-containing protein, partial [Mesorhizobium sp. LNHC229A00]|uniref:helix-turn-helix domain-containing protein n=2 Tax=unclassified Mesorhizobium TaxID=325217 RepID=UPI0003CED5B4